MQARKYVPENLPLVNFFGWTLGGFYLARYSDSPVGPFDELVALAGLAWNFPTSCAWAARVYVNNKSARNHGLSVVGLPSRLASFKAIPKPSTGSMSSKKQERKKSINWWSKSRIAQENAGEPEPEFIQICNREKCRLGLWGRVTKLLVGKKGDNGTIKGLNAPVCSIEVPEIENQWAPTIQMFLPSYSGATPTCPDLLKYSLRMFTKVRIVPPVKIKIPEKENGLELNTLEAVGAVLGGRPLLCMAFENMEMQVEAPETLELPS